MDEYISKSEAIKAIRTDPMGGLNYERLIRIMLAADVRPVRPGRWIPCHPLGDDAPEGYMCSVCRIGGWEKTNFCPICGADMREEEGDG